MTGEWLVFCSACPVPEIANVLSRAGIAFHQVTGVLKDDAVWAEIGGWIAAARVRKALSENRLGLMGHYYSGMLDIQTDLTQIGLPRRGWVVHRVLRAGSEGGHRVDGARRAWTYWDCGEPNKGAASLGLSRKGRPWPIG